MKGKNGVKTIIIIVFCAALCLGYYFYLTHHDTPAEERALTEFEQLTHKDLDQSYPSTPREVIKFYNRILLCMYEQDLDNEDLTALAEQAQKLMDTELLEQNPEEMYVASLSAEINSYKEQGRKIISTTLASSKEIETRVVDGRECAYVDSSYYIQGDEDSSRAYQTYILRKSEEGRWKILGFYAP